MLRTLALFSLLASAHGATPGQIREAATRALALIQSSQQQWDDGWACASCHHQYLPAIAYQSAREHGLPVDEKIGRADAEMAFRGLSSLDAALHSGRPLDAPLADSYRLWAAEAAGVATNLAIQADVRLMARRQYPDGHWASMDQRPPQSNSPFTATALAIRSLRHYSHPNEAPDVKLRVARGQAWLHANQPGDTEGCAFRLLGLDWAGESAFGPATKALLASQQSDGGWNSIEDRASDAYSTGEALVALADAAKIPTSDPAWQRGIEFLLRTQQRDGSWHVATRLHPPAPLSPEYFESGYPYEHDQYLSILGANWAVMALARALGPAHKTDPPVHKSPKPDHWAETALFGSAANLQQLLDAGLDPNTATPEGTTLLMMAVPDLAKTKLLLDRGAKADTRARSKFSALDVAAQYRDSGPVFRLLLERGAQPSSTADTHTPQTAVLAAFSGNAEALRALNPAFLNQPMIIGNVLYATPLVISSMTGDTDTVRTLLDLGAEIDKPDQEGLTALMWATLANRTEVARLLLDRGANPNLVDMYTMTALLYAASVDYGDSAILNLLLTHGARKDVKTKEAQTPLDRARMFHHTRFLKLLGPDVPGRDSSPASEPRR
jgi:N-acyl-D-amino-acid deacylase